MGSVFSAEGWGWESPPDGCWFHRFGAA